MTTATRSFISKPLKLAGVDLASRSQIAAMQSQVQSILQPFLTGTMPDSSKLVDLLNASPARTVFADESGKHYAMLLTPAGPIMIPWQAGASRDPENELTDGGFLPADRMTAPSSETGSSPFFSDVQKAAYTDLVEQQQSKGLDPVALAKSIGQGILQGLATQGLQELFKGAKLGDLLTQATSTSLADLGASLASGLTTQLAGMGVGLAFNAVWGVDDQSSAAEHIAHEMVGQGVQTVVGAAVTAQLTEGASTLGNLQGVLSKYLPAQPQPMFAALRQGDVDRKGNMISGPCSGNVNIEGMPAARVADPVNKSGVKLYLGSANVSTNGQIATRIADTRSLDDGFALAAVKTFIGGATAGELPPVQEILKNPSSTKNKTAEKETNKKDINRIQSDDSSSQPGVENYDTPEKRRKLLHDLVLNNKKNGMDDLHAQAEAIRTALANGAILDRSDLYAVFTGIPGIGATAGGYNHPTDPNYVKLGDSGMDDSVRDYSDNQTFHIWVYTQIASEQGSVLSFGAIYAHELDELLPPKFKFPDGTPGKPGTSGASIADIVAGHRGRSIGIDLASGKLGIHNLPDRLIRDLGIKPLPSPLINLGNGNFFNVDNGLILNIEDMA